MTLPLRKLQDSAAPPRIVDIVFGVARPERRRNLVLAATIAAAVHAGLWLWAQGSERSLESWSSQLAERVRTELDRDELVELQKPSPPKEERIDEPPQPPPPSTAPPAHSPEPTKPPAPAQAAAIVAQAPNPDAPADLTGETFVTGNASAYAGGITASNGTNTLAVQTRQVSPQSNVVARLARPASPASLDRSSPVALSNQVWSCAWPQEADAERIDEQSVVIRVIVRTDGSVESTAVVSDPGHGFGQAALSCARRTRFSPARDRDGRLIRAQSPPIRVRFSR